MKTKIALIVQIFISEVIKLRSTFAFWLSILYPLGTLLLVSLLWISMRNRTPNLQEFIINTGNTAGFFLPFFIVLIISVSCNIEHKSSMLKHIASLPVPRHLFYFGKFAGIMFYILLAFIATLAFTYLSLFICGLFWPTLGFGNNFNHLLLITTILRGYLAAAAIYPIQFWLGMKLKNLTMPVAIGSALIILPIATLIIMGISGLMNEKDNFTRIITYDPYSYPFATAFNLLKTAEISLFPTVTIVYIGIGIVILLAGSYEFSRRNIG